MNEIEIIQYRKKHDNLTRDLIDSVAHVHGKTTEELTKTDESEVLEYISSRISRYNMEVLSIQQSSNKIGDMTIRYYLSR